MKQLFALNVRASLASITMYYISNNVDIYIFEKGTIIDEGSHEKLLNSCNMYSVLWQEQCA